MPKINIEFIEESLEKTFEYEESCTIEEMLKDFLRQTHSKMTLDPREIAFLYRAKLLNYESYLNKTLKEVFKARKKSSIRIKVIECCGVVDCGNYYYITFIVKEDNEISNRIFRYEESCTIKEMLEDFLRQTNYKTTLNPEEITFIYQSRILNKEGYLNKTLKEVFKLNKNWVTIRFIDVIDPNEIV